MKYYACFAIILLSIFASCQKANNKPPIKEATALAYQWAITIGGTGSQKVQQIKTDAAGNIYILGRFIGTTDFDPGTGVFNLNSFNGTFLAKYNREGKLEFAKNISATYVNYNAMAVDAAGNIYLTGDFEGIGNFVKENKELISTGSRDIFFMKYNSNGNLAFIHQIGGNGFDEVESITLDNEGEVYLGGHTSDIVDFDPGTGIYNLQASTFLVKYNGSGNFVFAKNLSAGSFNGICLTTDAQGNIYAAGLFYVDEFYQSIPNHGPDKEDYYVSFVKYDRNGKYINAIPDKFNLYYHAYSIALDNKNDVYITGRNLENDLFLIKYDDKSKVLFEHNMGDNSTYNDNGKIIIDPLGDISLYGSFFGKIDFNPSDKINELTSSSTTGEDIHYWGKYTPNGEFISIKEMDGVTSMVVNGDDFYIASSFTGTKDIDFTEGIEKITSAGEHDVFISKYSKK